MEVENRTEQDQSMATVWHQWLRKSIQSSSTLRAVHTLKVDPSQPMLKSPPLISLDLPDVWTSNVMDFDPPSIGECCLYSLSLL